MGRLDGKVAIVTGGATGLGRGCAQLFAEEGAKIAIGDLRVEEAERTAQGIRDAGGEAIFVPTNVASSEDAQNLVRTAEDHFGAVHILTACAGILGRGAWKPLEEIPEDEFGLIMDVNFGGVWLAWKYAIPAIRRAGGGAMTATASLAANRGYAGLSAYSASKGAIVALGRSLAVELYPEIRVNVVACGGGEGAQLDAPVGKLEGTQAERAPAVARPPFRGNTSREGAHAHLFLVSEESSFVNGQLLVADAGMTVAAPETLTKMVLDQYGIAAPAPGTAARP
jgi:NAD(P)-dependent dehydrogenase (short-subunit alcohol dehydrogenase family)